MNNEEAICSIQQLPYEVLCKIFDNLDLTNVKRCSRTCRRWQETVFSDYYIKRFKLAVNMPLYDYKSIHTLEQSDRLYCNMDIELTCRSELKSEVVRIFNGFYSIFCYPKLEQLVKLELSIEGNSKQFLRMLTDTIARMKVLRDLYIKPRYSSYCTMNNLQIRSSSIQLLDVQYYRLTVIKAPKLASLRILINSYDMVRNCNFEKLLYSCRLPSLKSLEIDKKCPTSMTCINNMAHVMMFFSNLEHLEKLKLKMVQLSGFLFKTICENCTNLTELSIDSLYIMKTSTLRDLSNLAKLRHLQFANIHCLEQVSFQYVKLPNLESLKIGSFAMLYTTLDAFKSVTKITILSEDPTSDFIAALAMTMPKLKQVELTQFSTRTIQLLNLLTTVEVLTVSFPLSMFMHVQLGNTTIKEIHSLAVTSQTSKHIAHLRVLFPKLQLLTARENIRLSFQN